MAVEKTQEQIIDKWVPKTELGRKVKAGEMTDLGKILDSGVRILEPEIIDKLLPDLTSELIEVGQSKGKFGGGKESIWKQTQKKTSEGNTIKFSALAVVGNRDGYVGIGFGGAKETLPAREKAIRNAKLNVVKIARGCGSWACDCRTPHSIPYTVKGKSGSVQIELMPAPRGTGLKAERKCGVILSMAGIKDIYTKSEGQTSTKLNFLKACYYALRQLTKYKVKEEFAKEAGIVEGRVQN
ncbi:MAG TPA: 30S ribosomal protein S5 [Candidatus Nanoarchaeia archaeon]|nr:30S ribosomal protein S5 [Candidatus Nanoarchaeia archaeon]